MWEQVEQQNKNDMNETNCLQYASLPSDAAKPHTLGLLNDHSLRSHAGKTWLGVELQGPTFARQSFRGSGRERLLLRTVRKSGSQWPCRKAANKVITQWFKLVPLVPSHACSNPQPRCLPILRWPACVRQGGCQSVWCGRDHFQKQFNSAASAIFSWSTPPRSLTVPLRVTWLMCDRPSGAITCMNAAH